MNNSTVNAHNLFSNPTTLHSRYSPPIKITAIYYSTTKTGRRGRHRIWSWLILSMRRISFRLGHRKDSNLRLHRLRMQRKMFRQVIVRGRKKRRKTDRKVQRNRLRILRKIVSLALKRANQRINQTTMASASLTSPARLCLLSTNHRAALLNPHPNNIQQ